jgi:hypothetical protein
MRITLIIGQYKQNYPGQLMPNVLDAWDEFAMDENNEGFQESLKKFEGWVPKELDAVRTLDVIIPDDVVLDLFVTPIRPTLWKQVDR